MTKTGELESRLGLVHGIWLVLFKVSLLLLPFGIGWGVWVTGEVYKAQAWMSLGPRFTPAHASEMEIRTRAETDRKIEALARTIAADISDIKLSISKLPTEVPPKWWEDYVRENFASHDRRIRELEGAKKSTP